MCVWCYNVHKNNPFCDCRKVKVIFLKNRILKIQNELQTDEALLILSDANRFYFTGFPSSAGNVIITKQNCIFLIDFRYFEKAKSEVITSKVVLLENFNRQIAEILKEENIKTLYLETQTTSISKSESLKKAFLQVNISSDDKFDNIITDLRAVKTADELQNIRLAQQLTDKTFTYILNNIKAGRTEREIMLDMEFYMRSLGSEGVSFDFIVVSGKNSSLPHGVPTDKPIERGDFITMDFGAVVSGYRSDMTRTVALGNVTDEQTAVYNTVLDAQLSALKEIHAGVICSDIDKIARDIIYTAGYKGCFGHALGHSVGIEIHESPALSPNCADILKTGTVMTVEPGIYIENKFGVRIEDMVFVEDNGCENITKSEKKLIVL